MARLWGYLFCMNCLLGRSVGLDCRAFMLVRVLFFGVLKELAGKAGEAVNLRPGATVGDLLKIYESEAPRMRDVVASLAVAVNRQYASQKTELKEDDEVALL